MSLARVWRQCKGLFQIYVQDGLAYKASGMIWVMTDVSTAVTMPLVWLAAAAQGPIGGYSSSDLVLYYLCLLLLSNFILCHFMWDISSEIREGVFSSQLMRPVPYLQFILVRNFAWRCIRCGIFLPWFVLIVYFYRSAIGDPHLYFGWEFWVSVLLGHLLSVVFVTAFAMIALFTQEAQAIFEVYYIPMLFLSGQLFPMALFPTWVKNIAVLFPFYYTTGAPTEILIGRIQGAALYPILGTQLLWIGVSLLGFKLLWSKGLKQYASVGM